MREFKFRAWDKTMNSIYHSKIWFVDWSDNWKSFQLYPIIEHLKNDIGGMSIGALRTTAISNNENIFNVRILGNIYENPELLEGK